MIAIIDYDAGNIKSVEKAIISLGEDAVVTRDAQVILNADGVILPGVGAFGDAMDKLHTYGLVEVIHECVKREIPFLGICLGLQLMFESSDEAPGVEGLGILPGKIVRIPDGEDIKVPHIGWKQLAIFLTFSQPLLVHYIKSRWKSKVTCLGCDDFASLSVFVFMHGSAFYPRQGNPCP